MREYQRKMLAALECARRRRLQCRRRLGISRRNVKKRRIKAFKRKLYLENVLFIIVLLFVARVTASSGETDMLCHAKPMPRN